MNQSLSILSLSDCEAVEVLFPYIDSIFFQFIWQWVEWFRWEVLSGILIHRDQKFPHLINWWLRMCSTLLSPSMWKLIPDEEHFCCPTEIKGLVWESLDGEQASWDAWVLLSGDQWPRNRRSPAGSTILWYFEDRYHDTTLRMGRHLNWHYIELAKTFVWIFL